MSKYRFNNIRSFGISLSVFVVIFGLLSGYFNAVSNYNWISFSVEPCGRFAVISMNGNHVPIDQMYEPRHEKTLWFSNRSDTNQAIHAQKMARGWKVWI